MREVNFLHNLNLIPAPQRHGRSRPFPDAIHRQDQRILKRRRIKRARRMTHMMLGEKQLLLPVESRTQPLQLFMQQRFLKQLLADPQRHCHLERSQSAWRIGEIRFEQPLELQERLVVKNNKIDIAERAAGLYQAILGRVRWKSGIVLLAREALLLRGRDNFAIAHQRRGAVVIKSGDSQNLHVSGGLEQRVNEWCDGGTLRQHQQYAEQQHHDQNRQQPILLAGLEESPELLQK